MTCISMTTQSVVHSQVTIIISLCTRQNTGGVDDRLRLYNQTSVLYEYNPILWSTNVASKRYYDDRSQVSSELGG